MSKLEYIQGDLFKHIKQKNDTFIILPHICNDKKKWGAGFVLSLEKHYPVAKFSYLRYSRKLGDVDLVFCDNMIICNMIAQTLGGKRPLFYNHLATCLNTVANTIQEHVATINLPVEIHAPAFGTGLAKGDWGVIYPLIEDAWVRCGIPVYIYFLPGTFTPPNN